MEIKSGINDFFSPRFMVIDGLKIATLCSLCAMNHPTKFLKILNAVTDDNMEIKFDINDFML